MAFAFTLIIVLGLTFEKTFQAVGRMKATMASLLAGCVTNIVLDPLLIFGLGPFPQLGITGAALATGLGQSLTLGIYLVLYHFRPIPVTIARRDMAPTRTMVRRLYAIGVPATLNLALPSVLVSALNGILATFSQGYVLVLGIYYKLQTFLYLPANGFVQGMRPLVGYNYGAGEIRRVRQISRVVLGMSGLILAAGTVVCQAIPAQLMGLFTANPETVAMGAVSLRVISLGFVVSAGVWWPPGPGGAGREAALPWPSPAATWWSSCQWPGALPNHAGAPPGVARLLDHRGGGRCGSLGSIPPGPPQPSPAEGNPRLSPAGTRPFLHRSMQKENFFRFPSCNVSCVVVSYKWSYMQGNFLAPLVAGQRAGFHFLFPFFRTAPGGLSCPAWGRCLHWWEVAFSPRCPPAAGWRKRSARRWPAL